MRITILYDNTSRDKRLIPDWGFSCLVETNGRTILFDTGAKTAVLSANMNTLDIDPDSIDDMFISHDHWDHTGGITILPDSRPAPIFVPGSFNNPDILRQKGNHVIRCRKAGTINPFCFTTGELLNGEQSLAVRLNNGKFAVIAGCAHPGVGEILKAASAFGSVTALIGGLHDFDEFDLVNDLEIICPTHCTRHIDDIAARFPRQYISGGAGKVIEL